MKTKQSKSTIMKTTIVFAAAILFSAASFAQNAANHGTTVSSTARATQELTTKGSTVSEAASIQSEVHAQSDAPARLTRKAARQKRKAEKALASQSRKTQASVESGVEVTTGKAKQKEEVIRAEVKENATAMEAKMENVKANTNNEHGVTVSTTAKASADVQPKGATISEVASVKSAGKGKTSVKSATRVKATRPAVKTRVNGGVKVGIK